MINENKVSFITCVNNPVYYEEAKLYIEHLYIPEGIEIEFISIYQADSMTAGYNQGMRKSNAKYKVYLHQDVFITNKNFLEEILALFKQNSRIGMIGLAGCEKLPKSGIWWLAENKYGNIYHAHAIETLHHKVYGGFDGLYAYAQAIDGLLMATQYDIEWRQDLFTGWHFYDISQSLEFLRNGYLIVVPRQEKPWCVHVCGSKDLDEYYELYKETFLQEYERELKI